MAEYLIDSTNLAEITTIADEIDAITDAGGQARVKVTTASKGTWPMLKLWRAWMNQICEHLNERGRYMPLYFDENGVPHGKRPMNPQDCHEAYSHLALGCDETGKRLSWALSDGKSIASTGQRVIAMDKVWDWAMGEGIPLINPQDSEYRKNQGY